MKTVILLAFSLLCINQINAQRFHAFLFCKTNDNEIGNSVRINYENMREELQLIAFALNYDFIEHSVTGFNFNVQNVRTAIEKADVKEGDVVFLYFSTHGAKSTYDSNIFPQIDIPNSLVSAYGEHKLLLAKKPKLIITAIEACSGYEDITPQEAFVYEQSVTSQTIQGLTQIQIENIKTLFSSPCEIIITAGEPGKNTWATSQGSMFTNCFLRAINEYINIQDTQNVTWNKLLNQAKQYTWDMTTATTIQYYPVWQFKRLQFNHSRSKPN